MTKNIRYVKIDDVISPKLGFRDLAESFFHKLKKEKSDIIEIDFRNVEFISRSFAHEYLQRKKNFEKEIREINVPNNVRNMFEYVLISIKKPQKAKIEPVRAVLS